jgi:hypothetical protein
LNFWLGNIKGERKGRIFKGGWRGVKYIGFLIDLIDWY